MKGSSIRRWLWVWTNPKALGNGRGNVLGKVTLDTDWYGQQPLRPVQ